MNRCPDSATCKATPDSRGRCPFHAEHVDAAAELASLEADTRHLWATR